MAALASYWLRHFSTSLKPLNGIQRNLIGSKISTSATKFVCRADGINKMAAVASDWLRHFRLSSETAEWNSTKLGRKQHLNVLYQVYVFWADRKNKMTVLASDWLRHVLTSLTSVFDFHSKNLQITSKLLTQGYRYHKLRKTFGKFFRSYSELLSKFGEISFQDYVSQGIAHPVFYGDLVYKLRRVKGEANFISSGSKIVKRLRRRQYDPAIIERTIGLVLGPFTALYRSFLKRCTLTNKAVGTI